MVLIVRHVYVASGIHRYVVGKVERRAGGRTSVARVSEAPIAGDRGDVAIGRHQANPAVAVIRNIKVAGGIHRHSLRVVELGTDAGGGSSIPGKTGGPKA